MTILRSENVGKKRIASKTRQCAKPHSCIIYPQKIMNIHNKTVIMCKPIVAPHHPSLCSAYQQICLINSSTHFSFCPIFPILSFYREHCCGQSSIQSFCLYRSDCVQGLLSCPQLSCMFRGRRICKELHNLHSLAHAMGLEVGWEWREGTISTVSEAFIVMDRRGDMQIVPF